MKTYPFVSVLIRLYWLALLILLGLLFSPLIPYFLPGENHKAELLLIEKDVSKPAISPELGVKIDLGKKLFRTNCATCHNKNMKSPLVGPSLGGVEARWSDYPITDLYEWIRNSLKLVEAGHPKAIEVYQANDKEMMTPFPNLTDPEIGAILAYIESVN